MKLINSWTKDRVITRIRDRVPTEGCGTPLGDAFIGTITVSVAPLVHSFQTSYIMPQWIRVME